MTTTIEEFFIKNKKIILTELNLNEKCYRDLDYLLTAIFYDLSNSTKTHTVRNASKFWHRGKLQISSLDSKIPVYNELKNKLKLLLESNGFENLCDDVDNLFDLNELVLREGSMLESNERIWQDRRNFTSFLDIEVPEYLENHLDTCIQETPVQIHHHIAVCKLTKNEQHIKDFLVKNYLISPQNNHMIAVATAPLVYIVLGVHNRDEFVGDMCFNRVTNIHGGVMLAETLRHGYDFSFIGCGIDDIPENKTEQWKQIINERFGIECHPDHPWPAICWCIGKGDDSKPQLISDYELDSGDLVPAQPYDFKKFRKKEKVLFV